MTETPATFRFEGHSYPESALSAEAALVLKKFDYVDAKLTQLRNELAVAETARRAYAQAFAVETGTV